MRGGRLWTIISLLAAATLAAAQAQNAGGFTCSCGAHPPGQPKDRIVEPYAGQPADMSPWAKFTKPYFLNYTHPNIYSGAGRDLPDPKDVKEVRIGFFGPIENNPDEADGMRMLHGAQLAIEEANAHGGYGGKPFRLMLHNDYDNWQAKASYGPVRPTDPSIWGSPSNEAVKMIYDDHDWAIFGSINSESTHIMLRVALRAEIPIVNSASTDPTIPETYIPWYFTDLQDDRVQCFTLARRIYTELGLKRVALLRVNNRYGRLGVSKFRDASVRLGHPVVIEQKYMPGETDFRRALENIKASHADAIVLWANQTEAADILKQMRALGMKQPVFGSYRTLGPEMLAQAGAAAENFEAVFPYDPNSTNPRWAAFTQKFQERFHEPPEQFSALAYDAMRILLKAICEAGLNRARIHDTLADVQEYDGVTGHMIFDPNQKNVAEMYLGTVHDGKVSYRRASMVEEPAGGEVHPTAAVRSVQRNAQPIPYARVGEDGVQYDGPVRPDLPPGPIRVVVFGPNAQKVVASADVKSELARGAARGRAWELIPVASDQNWGAASTQLVQALWSGHPIAIIALDRNAAHLAEQMALKAFVPVVALSSDRALTSTNIPWIFRLPEQTSPAEALRLIKQATERSGANPEKLRDVLASGKGVAGLAFSQTGEPLAR